MWVSSSTNYCHCRYRTYTVSSQMLYEPEQSQYVVDVVETIESAVEEIVTEGVEIGCDSSIPSSIMDDS